MLLNRLGEKVGVAGSCDEIKAFAPFMPSAITSFKWELVPVLMREDSTTTLYVNYTDLYISACKLAAKFSEPGWMPDSENKNSIFRIERGENMRMLAKTVIDFLEDETELIEPQVIIPPPRHTSS